MSFVIALEGVESEKIVDGQRKRVIPFVGADGEGEFAQLGIGIFLPDEGHASCWGLVMPHALVQSWRGMKLLEKVDRIEHGTLCHCWTVAKHELPASDEKYLHELSTSAEGVDIYLLRTQVLNSAPPAADLESMINNLRRKEVGVDSFELEREVAAGRIQNTPLLQTLAREEEERCLAYQRKEVEIKRPVPREESLGVFFLDLGIGNFTIGGGVGFYGDDWDHILREELDRNAKRDSFSKYSPDGFALECTEKGPDTKSKQPVGSFGKVKHPSFTTADRVTYIFQYAKWEAGSFHILTTLERADMDPPAVASKLTISQLRELLKLPVSEAPLAQSKPNGWFRSLWTRLGSLVSMLRR